MAASKFNFDTDFETGAGGRSRKKLMSPEEIEAVRAEGLREGALSAEAKALNACALALGQVAAAVMAAIEHLDEEGRLVRREAAAVALAAGRALARAALARFPEEEVLRAVDSALGGVAAEPKLVIRVPDLLAERLEKRVRDLARERGFEGRIVLSADPRLQGADCRIEWSDGGAARTQTVIDEEIEEAIARAAAGLGGEAGEGG